MPKIIKLLVVDDHPMVISGLESMLMSMEEKYSFDITSVASGEQALKKAKEKKIDFAIIDYRLPKINGLITAKRIKKINKAVKVLIVSNFDESEFIERVLQSGVEGFALKSIDSIDLIMAIDKILSGERFCSPEALKKVFGGSSKQAPQKNNTKLAGLSTREKEVLRLIVKGYTSKKIAKMMKIATRTVMGHRQNILDKLNVKNTAEAIAYALKTRIIDED